MDSKGAEGDKMKSKVFTMRVKLATYEQWESAALASGLSIADIIRNSMSGLDLPEKKNLLYVSQMAEDCATHLGMSFPTWANRILNQAALDYWKAYDKLLPCEPAESAWRVVTEDGTFRWTTEPPPED